MHLKKNGNEVFKFVLSVIYLPMLLSSHALGVISLPIKAANSSCKLKNQAVRLVPQLSTCNN